MADWTNLPDTTFEPGAPAKGRDMRFLRDNPIAIAEGAPGAPRIQTDGIANSAVTAPKLTSSERMTTANVTDRIAGSGANGVGTYAMCATSSTNQIDASSGTTFSGSWLRFASLRVTSGGDVGFDLGGTPSGTWRLMGSFSGGGTVRRLSMFLRIS